MTSQKLENLLNLALDSTEEERKRSGIWMLGMTGWKESGT